MTAFIYSLQSFISLSQYWWRSVNVPLHMEMETLLNPDSPYNLSCCVLMLWAKADCARYFHWGWENEKKDWELSPAPSNATIVAKETKYHGKNKSFACQITFSIQGICENTWKWDCIKRKNQIKITQTSVISSDYIYKLLEIFKLYLYELLKNFRI